MSLSAADDKGTTKDIVYQTTTFDVPSSRSAEPGEFRIGLTTSNCPMTLFDSLRMGPIELMKATDIQITPSQFFEEASHTVFTLEGSTIPWSACQDAKTFLERQHLCKELFGNDAALAGKCSANFCSSCRYQRSNNYIMLISVIEPSGCNFHTSFRPEQDRSVCATHCTANDHFSNQTKTAFFSSLVQCVGRPSLLHPMDGCHDWMNIDGSNEKESMQCHRDRYERRSRLFNLYISYRCQACCQTFPAFDIIHDSYHTNIRNKLNHSSATFLYASPYQSSV